MSVLFYSLLFRIPLFHCLGLAIDTFHTVAMSTPEHQTHFNVELCIHILYPNNMFPGDINAGPCLDNLASSSPIPEDENMKMHQPHQSSNIN